MTPMQAWGLLVRLVSQTRALPEEVDAMRQALQVLKPKDEKCLTTNTTNASTVTE